MSLSVQERYAPRNACFGCGPANPDGLRVRSFPTDGEGDPLVAEWLPSKRHEAFPGVLNGGIVGALLDCHGNWTAARHLMLKHGESAPPCTVTAEFSVKLKRPASSRAPATLLARIVESGADRALVEATLSSGGKLCAVLVGTFVAVKLGHPAYHRW